MLAYPCGRKCGQLQGREGALSFATSAWVPILPVAGGIVFFPHSFGKLADSVFLPFFPSFPPSLFK